MYNLLFRTTFRYDTFLIIYFDCHFDSALLDFRISILTFTSAARDIFNKFGFILILIMFLCTKDQGIECSFDLGVDADRSVESQ